MSKLLLLTILFGCLINFAFAQTIIFSDDFESGTPSGEWGLYRAGEEPLEAVSMGSAPAVLANGGNYVGLLQDADASYTGAAIALAGTEDLSNYTIEADVFCYTNHDSGSAYTGVAVYGDSSVGTYIKFVADFDGSDRFRLYNNHLNFQTFQYTFHAQISPASSIVDTSEGWHHMKLMVNTVDDTTTEFSCYFDGAQIGDAVYLDHGVDQIGSGRFGLFAFQQSAIGLAGYFDNIVVTTNVSALDDKEIVANNFKLGQNYPNPFNPSTTIEFNLEKSSHTNLTVYNINGMAVKTLLNKTMSSGTQKMKWDGTDSNGNTVAAGVYMYMLKTNAGTITKKMILIK